VTGSRRAYRGGMGVLGEMFPGPRIRDESSQAGDGERPWQLGPIDLDGNVVVVHRSDAPAPAATDAAPAHSAHIGSAVPFDDGGDVERNRVPEG
jgi:hypothetical protein